MSCYFICEIIALIYPQSTDINSKIHTFVLQKGILFQDGLYGVHLNDIYILSILSTHLPSQEGSQYFRLILNHIYNSVIVEISLV